MSDTLVRVITKPEYLLEDDWAFWRRSLAREDVKSMLHEACPHQGYYRDGPRPVHFYFEPTDWTLYALIDGKDVDGFATYTDMGDGKFAYVGDTPAMRNLVERWTHLSERPVSVADYEARIENGFWPGEELAHKLSNMAPDDNSFEGIKAQLEEALREAESLMKAGAAQTKQAADRASNTVASIMRLVKTADALRVVEKKPHLDAEREVEAKWKPLIEKKTVYETLRKIVLQPWFDAQDRAKKKAEQDARDAAERLRREAADRDAAAKRAEEEAAKQANPQAQEFARKQRAEAEEINARATEQDAKAMTIAATPLTIGSLGHRARPKKVKETTITDREAFRAFALAQAGIRAEYEALDQKHADAFTRANVTAPGTTVTTKTVAA